MTQNTIMAKFLYTYNEIGEYMQFQFNAFRNYLTPESGKSWQPIAKTGLFFIIFGYIAILLKEILIFLISFGLFSVGVICLYVAFKIWKLNNFYSNNIYS